MNDSISTINISVSHLGHQSIGEIVSSIGIPIIVPAVQWWSPLKRCLSSNPKIKMLFVEIVTRKEDCLCFLIRNNHRSKFGHIQCENVYACHKMICDLSDGEVQALSKQIDIKFSREWWKFTLLVLKTRIGRNSASFELGKSDRVPKLSSWPPASQLVGEMVWQKQLGLDNNEGAASNTLHS